VRPPARDYGRIGVPTLLVRGQHDRLVPPLTWQELAAQIPGVRTETIGGSGHYPQIERSGEFVEAALGFLGRTKAEA
jgi:pimeloyl-ACP methyl ester carboxylesterase